MAEQLLHLVFGGELEFVAGQGQFGEHHDRGAIPGRGRRQSHVLLDVGGHVARGGDGLRGGDRGSIRHAETVAWG